MQLVLLVMGGITMWEGVPGEMLPFTLTEYSLTSLSGPPEAQTEYGPLPVTCSPMKKRLLELIVDSKAMVAVFMTESE
jgi:hypothetical protein